MPGSRLSLTAEGQSLCPTCYGTYQAAKADQRARANEVFRRCRCGAVLSPHGDTTIRPYHDGEADLSYYFQPSLYSCSQCGRKFRFVHPVTLAIFLVGLAYGAVGTWIHDGPDRGWTLLGLAMVGGLLSREIAKHWRYPRVR